MVMGFLATYLDSTILYYFHAKGLLQIKDYPSTGIGQVQSLITDSLGSYMGRINCMKEVKRIHYNNIVN